MIFMTLAGRKNALLSRRTLDRNRVMVALRFFAKLRTRAQKARNVSHEPVPAVARCRDGPDRLDQAQEGLDARHAAGGSAPRLGHRLLQAAGPRRPRWRPARPWRAAHGSPRQGADVQD